LFGASTKIKNNRTSLKPTLSLFDATAINVGAIIGAGIFVITGIVAGLAGSAMLVSLAIAAVVSLFTALSFAELSATLPQEGGAYEFAYHLISPFAGFIAGWVWVISNTFVGAAVALGFSHYLSVFSPGIPVRAIAVAIIAVFALLNILGTKSSAIVNNVLVVIKILILFFFIGAGWLHINNTNFSPFNPFEPGVVFGAYFIFFAFSGFTRISLMAAEVKDPKRNVPRSIILSLIISTVIYLSVAFVAIGLIGSARLGVSSSPLADASQAIGSPLVSQAVTFGGLIATASVLLTTILGVSRMSFSMAQNHDLPKFLGKIHPRTDTPYPAILLSSSVMLLLVFLSDLPQIVAVSTLASLIYYGIANFSAIRLQKGQRSYSPVIPLLGIISCASFGLIIIFKSPVAWIIGILILLAGIVVYRLLRKLT
jgi:APA family basic amino acid/polyamine antiporter